jgi:hypothetical protein
VATIGDPVTAQVADLFNAVYEATLQALSRYFVHSGETDAQVEVLAGPAFEITQPSFYVLPHRQAAWRILAERLEELAERAEQLSGSVGLGPLAELAGKLRGMAQDLQTARQPALLRSQRRRKLPPSGAVRPPG